MRAHVSTLICEHSSGSPRCAHNISLLLLNGVAGGAGCQIKSESLALGTAQDGGDVVGGAALAAVTLYRRRVLQIFDGARGATPIHLFEAVVAQRDHTLLVGSEPGTLATLSFQSAPSCLVRQSWPFVKQAGF